MASGQQRGAVLRQVQSLFNVGTVGDLSDGQLLERFRTQSGEVAELAFAALVERHGPMVLRVCRSVLPHTHDAQDAFQATFLVLLRRAGSLWVRDSLGAWLYQVALRTSSCARSAEARRRRHEGRVAEQAPQSVSYEGRDDLEEVLHEEVGRLPEHFRTAVILCLMEGLTHEQAARRLGWPVGTVESRLARGRERLRSRLSRRGLAPTVGAVAGMLCADPASAVVLPSVVEPLHQVARGFTIGQNVPAEAVSASVSGLVEGALRAMSMSKVKMIAAALVAVVGAVAGAGVLAQQERVTTRPVAKVQTFDGALGAGVTVAENVLKLPGPGPDEEIEIHRIARGVEVERWTLSPFDSGYLRVVRKQGQTKMELMFSKLELTAVSPGPFGGAGGGGGQIQPSPAGIVGAGPGAAAGAGNSGPLPDPASIGVDPRSLPADRDQEARLVAVERKLDQILKALDSLKAERPSK